MRAFPTSANQDAILSISADRLGSAIPAPATAIGFVKDTTLIGAVCYYQFSGQNITTSIWADDRSMWSRDNLRVMFDYAFGHCGAERITAIVQRANAKSLKMVRQLGFTEEGVMRRFLGNSPDDDGILFGMLRDECKWV